MAYIGVQPTAGQYRKLDNISASFNGSSTSFTTSVGGTNVTAGTAQQLIVSLGGVIQQPDTDYTVSTSTITFTTAPAAGLDFFAILMGDALNTVTPSDGSVTTAKLAGSLSVGLAAGSVSAPSLFFTGDTNNGIYSPSTDAIAVTTAGSERLRVTSAGLVGIGTSSPGATLDVSGNTKTSTLQLGTNPAGVSIGVLGIPNQKRIYGRNTANSADINIAYINGSDGMVFGPGDAAVIDSSGRLGIGTSSPSSLLHVEGTVGNAKIRLGTGGDHTLIGPDSSGHTIINAGTAGGNMQLQLAGSTKVTLNSTGLGIGTQSPDRLLTLSSATNTIARLTASTPGKSFDLGADTTGGYIQTTSADPIVVYTNNQERARWDSSGKYLVGTTSSSSPALFTVQGYQGSNTGEGIVYLQKGSTTPANGDTIGVLNFADSNGNRCAQVYSQRDGGTWTSGTSQPGRLVFSTTADGASSPTERMRITSDGAALFTKSGTYGNLSSSPSFHSFAVNQTNQWVLGLYQQGSTGGYGVVVSYLNSDPNNATNEPFYFTTSGGTRFNVRSNGGIANYQANNVNLCDEREKKNIVNLDSTWDCLKHWELKKFHYNEDADDADLRYGVIAQQVAQHCPEVISDWVKQKAEDAVLDNAGNVITPAKEEITRMAVKEQQMYWMAIKALQEAQVRIEALEAEVAALKAQ